MHPAEWKNKSFFVFRSMSSKKTKAIKEDGCYKGQRLYLTKTREEKDSPLIDEIRRKKYKEVEGKYKSESKFLMYFKVDKVLPLIGEGK